MINTELLYKRLVNKDELNNIPIKYIVDVAVAVIELLNDPSILISIDEEDM